LENKPDCHKRIGKEASCRLATSSRSAKVEIQAEPFVKTPKQSI